MVVWNEGWEYFKRGGKGGKGAWVVMAVVREVGEGALALASAFWNILWGGFFHCLCRCCKVAQ